MIIEIIFSKMNDGEFIPMHSKRREKDESEIRKAWYHKICKDSDILIKIMKQMKRRVIVTIYYCF